MNFLPTLKELVRAYQAFEGYSAPHIRSLGLTLVQFDVIATLGNQSPMTFKELGFKTLISKSALTGVVERMAQKGMLTISDNPDDARSQKITLSTKGKKIFLKVFPAHINHLETAFNQLSENQLIDISESLQKLRTIFLTKGNINDP